MIEQESNTEVAAEPDALRAPAVRDAQSAFEAYRILDALPEAAFDRIVELASQFFDVPVAMIGFIDGRRVLIKARTGIDLTDEESAQGLCLSAILQSGPYVVEDAANDPRTVRHPMVTGDAGIRFYAAVPIKGFDGTNLGTLCLVDLKPRKMTSADLDSLQRFGRLSEEVLDLRLSRIMADERQYDQLAMAEALPHMVWSARPDGWIDHVSRGLQEFSGLAEIDFKRSNWMEALHPADRMQAAEVWAGCVAGGRPYETELRIYHAASQAYRWHLVAARAHRGADGRIVRWYGSTIDIHDRKLAEDALRASEERLRAIVENEPECVKIVSRDGILREMNSAGLCLVEAGSAGQVIGRPIAELIHPDDRQTFADLHRRALAGETARDMFRICGLRGTERWIESHATPVRSADGKIDAVLSVSRDVTERRRSEAKLAGEAQKIQSILNAIPSGVHGVDASGRVIFQNPAALAMLGYEPEEIFGENAHDLIHHHRADGSVFPAADCAIGRTVRDGITRHVKDEVFFRKDGSRFPVEYTAAPILDAGGELNGAVISFRDVTAEHREADLRMLEARTLDMISAGNPLPEILEQIVSAVDRMLPGVCSSVLLVEGAFLRHGAAPHLPESYNSALDGLEIAEEACACGTAAWRRTPVIVSDITTDPLCANFRALAAEHGLRSVWSTPVLDAADSAIATFAMYYEEVKTPDASDMRFIERIGQYVRVAIERARQLENLERSEERYRSLYDLVPVSITEEDWSAVIAMIERLRQEGVTDFAGYFKEHPDIVQQAVDSIVILETNLATLEMLEVKQKEEFGFSLRDILLVADILPLFSGELVALANGETVFATEMRLRTLKGNLRQTLVNIAFPVPGDDSGRVLVSVMDITQRKQAEERFLTVARATSDVVWDWDLVTDDLWWSEGMATVFGFDAAAMEPNPRSWIAHIHPDDRERVETGMYRVIESSGTVWEENYRFQRADGSYAQVSDKGIVIRDGTGKGVRMIGSMVDHSERIRLEEQLQQSQRLDAVGQLTGGVAHDFNNLLTVILGNAETLSEALSGDRRLHMLADVTVKAAERGAELTGRLLAFARRQPLDPQPTDINRLVLELDRLVRRTLGEHIEIDLVRGAGLWQAMIDQGQLENAILNLCINARDAMPDGGRLTIETGNAYIGAGYASDHEKVDPGQYVLVAISDTGAGMERAVLERAFEPFFTTKEVGKGSGLGLSMVYGFVRQSNGHVRIHSELGRGTTVKLYLPRAEILSNASDDEIRFEMPQHGNEKILVVEDDDLVRDHVCGQLTGLGYKVVAKSNGNDALEAIRRSDDFDLLFTDIVMPGGMSGRQLADEARLLRPKLAVLFTSGYSENSIVHHGRLDRGIHLLAKPYRRQELADKVRLVLEDVCD